MIAKQPGGELWLPPSHLLRLGEPGSWGWLSQEVGCDGFRKAELQDFPLVADTIIHLPDLGHKEAYHNGTQ